MAGDDDNAALAATRKNNVGNVWSPKKSALKDVAYGSVAGMASKFFEHPFDLIKVRLQSQPHDQPLRFHGPLECAKFTWKGEGFTGFYRGVSMPVFGAMAENATLFLVYNQAQRFLRFLSPSPSPSAPTPMTHLAIAAAAAGFAASFILTPVELIKCQMQVQQIAAVNAGPLPGALALIRSTLALSGLRGLWLGQTGTVLRETGGGIAWFCAFETVARWRMNATEIPREKADLASWELMLAGACGGVGYNVSLFPADSIKSTMQTDGQLGSGGPKRVFLETGRAIMKARGWSGLYAGCGLTCLRSGSGSALIFWIVSRLEARFD